MNSLQRLPLRDLEDLSAYLDGELPASRAERLEARLKAEPALSAALGELRATSQALRSLPTLRPPRSLLLRPGAVPARQPPVWAFPTLRLATALSAIAFAVVTGLNAFARGLPLGPMAPAAAPESYGAMEAPQAADAASTEAAEAPSLMAVPPAEPAPSATAEPALRAVGPGTPDGLGGGLPEAPVEGAPGPLEEAELTAGEAPEPAPEVQTAAPAARMLPLALGALTLALFALTLWTRPRRR